MLNFSLKVARGWLSLIYFYFVSIVLVPNYKNYDGEIFIPRFQIIRILIGSETFR